jgi:CDP-diacylglycerol pyrophosphatase
MFLVRVRKPFQSGLEMRSSLFPDIKQGSFGGRLAGFRASLMKAAVCACAACVFLATSAGQTSLPRNALWEIVHNVCVPGQSENHNPAPCLKVDLNGGSESGFAILRDPRGDSQFLFVPIARISGIESPIVRDAKATNYFASAWESRTFMNEALHAALPRDDLGMAINSVASRSQDQLHIHLSCIRVDVWEALHRNAEGIENHWSLFYPALLGHAYMAMWVAGERLGPYNPFRLLAEGLPDAPRDMADRTLVVAGLTRADGTAGFVIFADRVNERLADLAFGEELLDPACRIVAMGK